MSALLNVENLSVAYGESQVVRGLSFQVKPKSITILLGANGAGKTTTLRAICGMGPRTAGVITLDGVSLLGRKTEEIARAGVAHVPDGRGTFVHFTVKENLDAASTIRRNRREVQTDLDRVFTYFPRLRERLGQVAGSLSGGEQQMLAIGRALMLRPRLLLLDEPSFGLAPHLVDEMFAIVEALARSDGISILLVEQNVALALEIADRAYLLEQGTLSLEGSVDTFRHSDIIKNVYLSC